MEQVAHGHGRALLLCSVFISVLMSPSHGGLDGGERAVKQDLSSIVRPRIYIYDMPEEYRNYTKHGDISDSFYGLDQIFLELLRSSPYHTKNPEEADYFTGDAWLYWDYIKPQQLIDVMREAGPWWDRKGGADHIFTISQDHGRCGYLPQADKSIVILHWGKVLESMKHRQCDLFEIWGAECDYEMLNAEFALGSKKLDVHQQQNCFKPGQDIVVPPTCFEPHPYPNAPASELTKPWTQEFKTPYIHPELLHNRTDLLFYSGKIDLHEAEPDAKMRPWSDAGYSFGSRQTLYRMFANHSAMALLSTHTHKSYWDHLASSIFCVSAPGWGWGGRTKVAVTRGCIPVIVQDGIMVEWEEQLPLKEYAIRVPLWLTHKMPDILKAFIATGRVEKMQKALECTWRLHWWRRPEGRAFELLMCELKRRLLRSPKVQLDVEKCALECGDGKWVPLKDGFNNV